MTELLHVTEAIKLCGFLDGAWSDQHAMDRGTAAHRAVELDIAGDLEESSVCDEVRPYLDSWRAWRMSVQPEIVAIERKVVHAIMRYQGRLDLILTLHGRRFVVDLKTGQPARWHSAQLALYALAIVAEDECPTPARAGLYLHREGGPATWIEYTDRSDFERARAIITVAHMRREMGGNV